MGDFYKVLGWPAGIYVFNENSMIDTERIDLVEGGRVGPQSVDLESMRGNSLVLNIIEAMKSNRNAYFFPGTLLRDFGGYSLPTMPVVFDGAIVNERVKQIGGIYIDDYATLAEIMFDKQYGERVSAMPLKMTSEEPLRTLMARLEEEVSKRRRDSLKSFKIGEYCALPIICNELPLIHKLYEGGKVNLILHSSQAYFEDEKARKEAFSRYLGLMRDKGLVSNTTIIAVAELGDMRQGYPSFSGHFVYDHGKFRKLNHPNL
jgi:hypothetical protein